MITQANYAAIEPTTGSLIGPLIFAAALAAENNGFTVFKLQALEAGQLQDEQEMADEDALLAADRFEAMLANVDLDE